MRTTGWIYALRRRNSRRDSKLCTIWVTMKQRTWPTSPYVRSLRMPTVSKLITASGHWLKTFITIQLLLLLPSRPLLLPTGHTPALRSMPSFKPRWALSQPAPSPETATDVANLDTGQENVPTRANWIPMWTTATTVVAKVAVDVAMAMNVVAMTMLAAVATPMTMVRINVTLKTGSMLLLLQANVSARLPMELHLSGVASLNIGWQATTLTCMASSMKPNMCLVPNPLVWSFWFQLAQHCLSMTCGHSWVPWSWASSVASWPVASGPTLPRLHPSSRHGSGPWCQSCGWPCCSPSSSIAPLKSPHLIIKSATSMPSNAIATLTIPSIALEVSKIMVSIASTQSIYAPWVYVNHKAPTNFQQTIMLQLKMLHSQVLCILQCVENRGHAPVWPGWEGGIWSNDTISPRRTSNNNCKKQCSHPCHGPWYEPAVSSCHGNNRGTQCQEHAVKKIITQVHMATTGPNAHDINPALYCAALLSPSQFHSALPNEYKYGTDYDKQRAIALETSQDAVRHLYEWTKHSVNDEESALLHSRPLEEILTWTKAHLDAFLATAEVILEQNVDPG